MIDLAVTKSGIHYKKMSYDTGIGSLSTVMVTVLYDNKHEPVDVNLEITNNSNFYMPSTTLLGQWIVDGKNITDDVKKQIPTPFSQWTKSDKAKFKLLFC